MFWYGLLASFWKDAVNTTETLTLLTHKSCACRSVIIQSQKQRCAAMQYRRPTTLLCHSSHKKTFLIHSVAWKNSKWAETAGLGSMQKCVAAWNLGKWWMAVFTKDGSLHVQQGAFLLGFGLGLGQSDYRFCDPAQTDRGALSIMSLFSVRHTHTHILYHQCICGCWLLHIAD